jgi:zinc/manganese transport system ATP-binding protein
MSRQLDGKRPNIVLTNAQLKRDSRMLWQDMNISINAGEFIAVLGTNGAGKTSLLNVLLGLLPLTKGSVEVAGKVARRGGKDIGYIPQQKSFDTDIPIRGRDLVEMGVNGFKYGFSRNSKEIDRRIDEIIKAVGAGDYADLPLGLLSGGEQQRLRIAQALVGQPDVLLCDEPLLSLDLASQQIVTNLINDYRIKNSATVIFVTHEINPVLQFVDRVLYLANGQWVIDTPKKVLQSKVLSDLYGTKVEVLNFKDRIFVVGTDDDSATTHDDHHGAKK